MPIYVTSPYLPDKKKLIAKISEIYHSKQLTNYGPNVQKLENLLQKDLKLNMLLRSPMVPWVFK